MVEFDNSQNIICINIGFVLSFIIDMILNF